MLPEAAVLWLFGEICFAGGGNKHLLFFSPQQAINTFKANTKNPIIITGIEVNNKPLIPGKPVNGQMVLTKTAEYTDYISLSHKNRDFALSFSNSPYPTAQKIRIQVDTLSK